MHYCISLLGLVKTYQSSNCKKQIWIRFGSIGIESVNIDCLPEQGGLWFESRHCPLSLIFVGFHLFADSIIFPQEVKSEEMEGKCWIRLASFKRHHLTCILYPEADDIPMCHPSSLSYAIF